MGRRTRLRRYSRRKSSSGLGRRVFIITVAVLAFLLLSLAISVAAGLALGRLADEHGGETPESPITVKDYYSGEKLVKAVQAHEYSWGLGTSYYLNMGITDFSVCLRDSDGFITYHSEVVSSIGATADMGSRNLSNEVADTQRGDGYVCGYFYSSALDESDPYKREMKKAYEIALISEAAKSGINDILVIGLKPDGENIGEMEAFVSQLSRAAGNSALGVLVSAEDVKLTDSGNYLVPRLRAVCDFTALDMMDMPTSAASIKNGQSSSELKIFLDEMEYYIASGSMRLVFSSDNSALMQSAVKLGATSVQVVGE